MNVSSISEAMQPTFRRRLKRACNQISFLETPTREVGLKNPYLICDYCGGSHEADECRQNNLAEQVYLFGGDIYDDPSLRRFYQNDDTPPWGPWVSPVQVVLKKGGMTVVKNEKNKLILQMTVIGWHILIALEDQEKTTFTCPYGTFTYKRMPFGLCNATKTFQCCITAIFHKIIEDSMEVFMDDFSVFGDSFDHCLKNLEKMLKRYEETNLVLIWEKCYFMVKEGIILGHKVLGAEIEDDKAKIKAISKLPYPTNVKAIRSFLGHSGFYK
uniref:Reverse transcriptase domain-containing protein n=1 Tax=Tanacetum cinerariifolium TaxID=118510 RepID=A0A6L2JU00_TANCI|nr:hypothetical protein [Tanacetum cinerariifolium]